MLTLKENIIKWGIRMDVKRLDHSELQDLLTKGLGQTRRDVFDFLRKRLGEICHVEMEKEHSKLNEGQLDYVAGILTTFSIKSLDLGSWPLEPPPSKEAKEIEVLKKRYELPNLPLPPLRCEKMGRLVLFIGSFEEDRLKEYYTDYWIVATGEQLFLKAAVGPRTSLLLKMSKNFGTWLNYLKALKHGLIRGVPVFQSPILIPKNPI